MIMRLPLLIIVLLLVANPAWSFDAQTKKVSDGDSILVTGPEELPLHIRLYGIDAPEMKQPFGYQAKMRLSKLVSRKKLQIEAVDTDRYNRTVALVRLQDGTLVNEVMVAEGWAWVYEQYCQKDLCQRLLELQKTARLERRGLWAESDPQRPSEWRQEHTYEEWYKVPVRVVKTLARKIKVVLQR